MSKQQGQSRKASMLEAFFNVAVGYCIAVLAQAIIFPLFDIHISTGKSMQIALAFTFVSIVRSYALRRFFNWVQLQGWTGFKRQHRRQRAMERS